MFQWYRRIKKKTEQNKNVSKFEGTTGGCIYMHCQCHGEGLIPRWQSGQAKKLIRSSSLNKTFSVSALDIQLRNAKSAENFWVCTLNVGLQNSSYLKNEPMTSIYLTSLLTTWGGAPVRGCFWINQVIWIIYSNNTKDSC